MKNNLLNHDCFNTWQTCRQKYYFKYIKELKYPEFHQDYEHGKSVHALIDYHLRGLNINHLLKNADKNIIDGWNLIKNHPVLDKKIIKTEWGFNTRLKDTPCWLIGRIDAIFYDEEKKKYIIADWKTGKFIPKKIDKSFQHELYLYAFYKCRKDLGLDFKPEDVCFQYFKIYSDFVDDSEKIFFSEEKLIEYEEKFIKIINMIENSENLSVPEICTAKFCEYKRICTV